MGHDTMQQLMARIEMELKQQIAQGYGGAAVDGPGRDGGAVVDDPGRVGAGGGLSVTDAGRKLTSLKMSLLYGQIPVQ